MRLLMISPCLSGRSFGGVQLSGLIAWNAIDSCREIAGRHLLCFGSGCPRPLPSAPNQSCTQSKAGAALAAFRHRGFPDTVLLWHLGMAKLLPFLNSKTSTVFLFLHGVECWKPLSPSLDRLLGQVGVFLTNSQFTWERFLEHNPRWRGSVQRTVPLGLGVPAPESVDPPDPPSALIVGRMDVREDYKGHRQLIEAWPEVLKRVPGARLLVAGSGDLRPVLEARSRELSLDPYIDFRGSVTEEEKQELIASSRCLVMPSSGEGFGLVYLEAMRLGRPCLAGSADAGREVLSPPEAGLAVDPDRIPDLACAIARLLQPGAGWRAWSARARARYESAFTAAEFQGRLLNALTTSSTAR